jgi:5-methylcytosine-specific restriction endonuclease McrA
MSMPAEPSPRKPRPPRVRVTCAHCGAAKTIPPSRTDRAHHFCSRKCQGLYKTSMGKVRRACRTCGEWYSVCLAQIADRGSNYCSRACMHAGMRTRTGPRVAYWRRTNRQIRARDGNSCQLCQSPDRLDVHHIVPADTYADDEQDVADRPSNLITLCSSCHRRAEYDPSVLYGTAHGQTHQHEVGRAILVAIHLRATGSGFARKLTTDAVRDVRGRLSAGEKVASIAALYGVTPAAISALKWGRVWSRYA